MTDLRRVVVLLLLLTTAGCNVTSHETTDRGADVLAHPIVLDLSTGLTRAQFGMGPDDIDAALQRHDHSTFPVTVRLRDGRTIEADADTLMAISAGAGKPVTRVEISMRHLSRSAWETALSSAIDDLGVDPDVVAAYEAGVARGGFSADEIRSFDTDVKKPDRVQVESIVTALEGRRSVSYSITRGQG